MENLDTEVSVIKINIIYYKNKFFGKMDLNAHSFP